jgi:hypothetical protein
MFEGIPTSLGLKSTYYYHEQKVNIKHMKQKIISLHYYNKCERLCSIHLTLNNKEVMKTHPHKSEIQLCQYAKEVSNSTLRFLHETDTHYLKGWKYNIYTDIKLHTGLT